MLQIKIFAIIIINMPRPVLIQMKLLSPLAHSSQIFQMQPSGGASPSLQVRNGGYKQLPTMSIGVGMIDRLSKNVASCNACGH
jgi:hypothetical protein